MLNTTLKKMIDERLVEMPEYMQDALTSFDWMQILEEISAKYKLLGRQHDAFVGETSMLLLEIIDPGLYKSNLLNHVGVSEMIAHGVITDVKSRVVDRLQKELVRLVGLAPEYVADVLTPENAPSTGAGQSSGAVVAAAQNNVDVVAATGDKYHEAID